MIRGRYYQQVSGYVRDALGDLARRTDELATRRTDLAGRSARLRAGRPVAADEVVAAEEAAADALAHAIAAHRRAAVQHERTAVAHERCAELLDQQGGTDRALHHRLAAALERDAAKRSRAEADRAEREQTPSARK